MLGVTRQIITAYKGINSQDRPILKFDICRYKELDATVSFFQTNSV